MPNSDSIVIFSNRIRTHGVFVHAVVVEDDFPLKINFHGKVYDLIKTRQGRLRLGKISEEVKIALDK